MFSAKQLIEAVEKFATDYNVPVEDIVISAGGSMVYHGYRFITRDIDASVPEDVFSYLAEATGKPVIALDPIGSFPGVKMLSFPELGIEVHCGIPTPEDLVQLKTLPQRPTCWFLTPDALYRQKAAMGRQKDLDDIVRMQLGGYKIAAM